MITLNQICMSIGQWFLIYLKCLKKKSEEIAFIRLGWKASAYYETIISNILLFFNSETLRYNHFIQPCCKKSLLCCFKNRGLNMNMIPQMNLFHFPLSWYTRTILRFGGAPAQRVLYYWLESERVDSPERPSVPLRDWLFLRWIAGNRPCPRGRIDHHSCRRCDSPTVQPDE